MEKKKKPMHADNVAPIKKPVQYESGEPVLLTVRRKEIEPTVIKDVVAHAWNVRFKTFVKICYIESGVYHSANVPSALLTKYEAS